METSVWIDGSIFGVDTEGSEEPCVKIDPRELIQYRFNWDLCLQQIRKANGLDGVSTWLHERLVFLGEKTYTGRRLGFVLGFFNHREVAMDMLLGLPARMPSKYDVLVVTTLIYDQLPQQDAANLERLGVCVVPPIDRETLKINISCLAPERQARPPFVITDGSKGRLVQNRYKTQLPVLITGEREKWQRNTVIVNGLPVALGDGLFLIFLRLCVQLVKSGNGMKKAGLRSGGCLRSGSEEQTIGRLRSAFGAVLEKRTTHDFIESYGRGMIRISTSPDLVKYNRERLRSHGNEKIKHLAEQLP